MAPWLSRLLGRALAPWGELGCEVLLERSLRDDLPAVKPEAEVTLRLALPEDIDEITRLYSSDPWLFIGEGPTMPGHEKARELYLDRLRRGELCFLAMSGDAIAHVNWICFAWGDALPEHPIRLRTGEVYTTDALTLPAFRGKGLHAFVLRVMLAHARARRPACLHAGPGRSHRHLQRSLPARLEGMRTCDPFPAARTNQGVVLVAAGQAGAPFPACLNDRGSKIPSICAEQTFGLLGSSQRIRSTGSCGE
jgi:GNAT superfamily N-acetyltransferase